MAVRLSALRACRTSVAPRKIPDTDFCYRLSRLQGHSATGRIRSIEKCNDLIGNGTRDLSAAFRSENERERRILQETGWASKPVWTREDWGSLAVNSTAHTMNNWVWNALVQGSLLSERNRNSLCCFWGSYCRVFRKGLSLSPPLTGFLLGFLLKMEAVCSSETSMDFYRSTRCYVAGNIALRNWCYENLPIFVFHKKEMPYKLSIRNW
jgi:hypothetical protein